MLSGRHRAHKVSPRAAGLAVEALQARFPDLPNPEAIVRIVAQAYAPQLLKEKSTSGRYSQHTRKLAAMQVGEIARFHGTSSSMIHAKCRAARLLSANPQMKWRTDAQPDGWIRVTRMADGARRTTAITSDVTRTIMAMEVGDSAIITTLGRRECFTSAYKSVARRIMGRPDAQWTSKQTTKGVRVTRVA